MRDKRKQIIVEKGGGISKTQKICIIVSAFLMIIAVGLIIWFNNKKTTYDSMPDTAEEKIEKYVGPMDVKDHGEWEDTVEYYSFYGDDAKEVDVPGTLFAKEGEMKGIVPAGVRLEPVLVTYEDFEPYEDQSKYGYMDSYSCEADPGEVELQLGVTGDINIKGSYQLIKEHRIYDGNVNVELRDMQYFMEQLYDPDKDYDGEPTPEGYGFINPNFMFDYSVSGGADIMDDYDKPLGSIEFNREGSLDDGTWKYTSNLSGQGDDIFRQGEIYLRCKLPCDVKKEIQGISEAYEGHINIYFRINEVRIGTRGDCIPEHALNRIRGVEDAVMDTNDAAVNEYRDEEQTNNEE